MLERGFKVDYSTINRWILKYSPELDRRCRRHLKPTNDSWRVDETYLKIRKKWRYLYRAVDSDGNPLDFLLSTHSKAESKAAKRFLTQALNAVHTHKPRVINVDKNPAYPPAVEQLQEEERIPKRRKSTAG